MRMTTLNTAFINIVNGPRTKRARATLNTGSSDSLITEHLAASLKLKRRFYSLSIIGLSDGSTSSKHYVNVELHSIFNSNDTITDSVQHGAKDHNSYATSRYRRN